uniref:Protein disulfide-isomerase n=1 Tax=Chromera velia CCMP2878 TaxID=1169474 RepID=A0A0G4GFL7_9ALVE|eukprot:Cvel_21680.t1-p1 / transcript=Cvel_21680.t1 / gene=Cvel_21680 / organism=Chromera_velia_CCMP2878 / gene_product=Protein disulfide-isomerase A4, putative / transcript_product=Protein disulfide-isomerase A4, putative / location=Cvel_scaffold2055:2062-10157(-) / protein_length=489 / sequence_SO=supercontig / SO=protein_coding / is_pseudo=false
MTALSALLVLLLSLSLHSVGGDGDGEDFVVVLTDDNMREFVSKNSRVLVEFYAPWCGHCKALEPEYKEAASVMKNAGMETVLAKVDATKQTGIASEFEIRGYPTLKYFVNGSPQDYNGPRQADGIVDWLEKREKPNFKELTEGEVDDFVAAHEFSMVVRAKKGSKKVKLFKTAVSELLDEKEKFGLVLVEEDGEVRTEYHRPQFNPEDDKRILTYNGKMQASELRRFLRDSRYPLISEKFDAAMYLYDPIHHSAIVALSGAEAQEQWKEAGHDFLESLRGEVYFTFIDLEDDMNASLLNDVAPALEEGGVLFLERPSVKDAEGPVKPKKFLLKEGAASLDSLKTFFGSWKAGKLPEYLKSEPVPAVNEGPVKVVVADSFDDVVLDPQKDVFVKYYAPWCGHCKSLAPAWDKLAETVHKKYSKVVIAKLDATANDVIDDVRGFPTLIFYPAGKKKMKMRNKMNYEGAREFESLLDFVEASMESEEPRDEL